MKELAHLTTEQQAEHHLQKTFGDLILQSIMKKRKKS